MNVHLKFTSFAEKKTKCVNVHFKDEDRTHFFTLKYISYMLHLEILNVFFLSFTKSSIISYTDRPIMLAQHKSFLTLYNQACNFDTEIFID